MKELSDKQKQIQLKSKQAMMSQCMSRLLIQLYVSSHPSQQVDDDLIKTINSYKSLMHNNKVKYRRFQKYFDLIDGKTLNETSDESKLTGQEQVLKHMPLYLPTFF